MSVCMNGLGMGTWQTWECSWHLLSDTQINKRLRSSFPSFHLPLPSPDAMTSHAVMSFLKIFSNRCPNQSAIARELWFTCCCLPCHSIDRETIDFLFLRRTGAPGLLPAQVEVVGRMGWFRFQETLINWEEGQTRPHQGYSLDSSVCVRVCVCSNVHGWNQCRRSVCLHSHR